MNISYSNAVSLSSICMILTGIITFVTCMIIVAPYGRYSKKKGWGILLPARIAWIIMESPNLWVPLLIYNFGGQKCYIQDRTSIILLGCFFVHYINRTIIFPLRMREGNPMPISVMILAFLYCLWNSSTQATYLLCAAKYPEHEIYNIRFILGICLFFIGMIINIQSDNILLKLALTSEKQPAPPGRNHSTVVDVNGRNKVNKGSDSTRIYKIPYGGLFEYVSSANYAGEILEWIGFAIASASLPATAFAIFTFCNIGPRGYQHHQWYKSKFDNYPPHRRAVIPFVW